MSIRIRSDRLAGLLLASALLASPALARAQEPPPAQADDALGALRARFKVGMEHYQAGRFSEAILEWEEIYRKLGPKEGYRLVFNIARAYDARGDARPAAERYEIYIAEVDARRAAGETLEPNVEHQAEEASARLAELRSKLSRIHVEAAAAMLTKIDREDARVGSFTVYVEPGAHTLTFSDPQATKTVQAPAGAIVDVEAPKPAPPPPPPPRYETVTEHPFSPLVLYGAAGVTLGGIVATVITFSNADSARNAFRATHVATTTDRNQVEHEQQLQRDYDDARTTAYTSLGVAIAIGAVAAAATTWFVLGTKHHLVLVPEGDVTRPAGRLGVSGAF